MKFTKVIVFYVNLVISTTAHEFLKTWARKGNISQELLKEIERSLPDAFGSSSASKHYAELEAALSPIYTALPKNDHDTLDHAAASYALHRLFMSRHGWAIQGLGPTSGKYNSSSPAGILKDQVPSYISDLFEKRLGGKGFNLHDLAVLAATIEHLIHDEAIQRLRDAFKIHDTRQTGKLTSGEGREMLDTYMTGFILSENLAELTAQDAKKLRGEMPEIFNYWKDTQEFVTGVHQRVTKSSHDRTEMDFAAVTKVAEAVNEKFGSFFHEKVCLELKERLVSIEHKHSGRIKLSDFYKPTLEGNWQFQESVAYLREIGALEENKNQEPSVIIANYMASPSNCIASGGFYSVCCKNECEGLVGRLEKMIQSAEAEPAILSVLVATLPASSSRSRGALPGGLRKRLDEIASHHKGLVPLHSRLFSQFMHHAYPHECPFPHLAGVTTSSLPEDWLADSGYKVSEEELLQYTKWSSNVTQDNEELIKWSPEEELLVVKPLEVPQDSTLPWQTTAATGPSFVRSLALWVGAASFAFGLVQTAKSMRSSAYEASEKFLV